MQPGELRERITFQARAISSDGYGNQQGEWVDEFTVAAKVEPRFGGEAIQAARLAGNQPVNITIRYSSDAAQITTDWRAVDARDATKTYNLRSVTNPDMRRRWIEILAEQGVAT